MDSAVSPATLIGQCLKHYHIVEKIGSGSMGIVYRAHDTHLDRDVAVKVLAFNVLADESSRSRFRNEALALSKLNHSGIATVHDFDTDLGVDFLVTELVSGTDLGERIARRPVAEKEIIDIGMQLAEALSAAHEKGIIHRDLKPANLRITPAGRLKILDFGLAVSLSTARDSTADVASPPGLSGTLPYISPEVLRGDEADARSDIYSAGVVLYEMAAGRPPFAHTFAPALIDAVLHNVAIAPGRLRAEISARLDDVILRCLEKNPAHRYASAADLLADLRRALVAAKPETSIAVMYFENLSGNKEEEYFRDGITEDITTELAKIKDLQVFSRSAVLAYRDKPVTPSYVGQQLGAPYVVEGSVRRENDRLRITAKLVQTRNGHTVWAERYDRHMEHVFAIQDEIAQSVAAALRLVLTDGERRAIEKIPTTDVRAYDLYLRGRHFFHQFRRRGLDFAREMFAKAIELDPRYARAYSGISDCYAFLYMYWESDESHLRQADEASRRALELDPDLAEAHASRGFTASLRKQYDQAKRELEIALRLDPKLFEAYYFNGRSCYAQGKLEEAVQWFEQANRVLPEDYQAVMLMASALNGLGRRLEAHAAYRRGLNAAEKHLEVHPGDARALYFGANALTQLSERERAIRWAERALELEAEEPQVLYNVACVYALLDEAGRALDCLEKSVTGAWGHREWMLHDPDLASLRDHPRFHAILEQERT